MLQEKESYTLNSLHQTVRRTRRRLSGEGVPTLFLKTVKHSGGYLSTYITEEYLRAGRDRHLQSILNYLNMQRHCYSSGLQPSLWKSFQMPFKPELKKLVLAGGHIE